VRDPDLESTIADTLEEAPEDLFGTNKQGILQYLREHRRLGISEIPKRPGEFVRALNQNNGT